MFSNSYNYLLELVVLSSYASEKHITRNVKPKEERNSAKFSKFLFMLLILIWSNERLSEMWSLIRL